LNKKQITLVLCMDVMMYSVLVDINWLQYKNECMTFVVVLIRVSIDLGCVEVMTHCTI